MAVERDDTEERQARLDAMVDEFRAAQHRRLAKRAIALWNRTAAAKVESGADTPPSEKLH